ncbi:MAG: ribosomal protein L11 methyltransferase [SAR202 cluster bacterium Io17-Chloro-G9]|nr:MAG: ribosomal protein L11 methyltransferase [SAR202 cluster bacterium Io17-Chloro-G9]
MTWQEISIQVPEEYVEPVSYLFSRYGHGLAMEPVGGGRVVLRTYLTTTSRQRLAHIEVGVTLINALEPVGALTFTPIEDGDDWETAWKSHFTLLEVGQRLLIKPSWIEHEASPEQVVIELDPGMAFGTGYHPTTYGCMEALERLIQPGMAVLDLGTGSGILTITALKLGADRAVAMDIDPQAIRAARQNFRRTRLQRRVSIAQGTLPNAVAPDQGFDLVVANISQRAICERAPFIAPTLKHDGTFVASGFLKEQQAQVVDSLTALGMRLTEECPREDWSTLVFRSR